MQICCGATVADGNRGQRHIVGVDNQAAVLPKNDISCWKKYMPQLQRCFVQQNSVHKTSKVVRIPSYLHIHPWLKANDFSLTNIFQGFTNTLESPVARKDKYRPC